MGGRREGHVGRGAMWCAVLFVLALLLASVGKAQAQPPPDVGMSPEAPLPAVGFLPWLTFVEQQKDGVGGVDGLLGTLAVALSPDGRHLYAASIENAVAVFSRDPSSGSLTFVEAQKDGQGGVEGIADARSVVVSPDGGHVYVAGEGDNAVVVFGRNASTGRLTFVELKQDGVAGVDGLDDVASLGLSPDGASLYAAGEDDDAVAVFSRNASTGQLTFVEQKRDGVGGVDGLDGVVGLGVSPDGKHVYTASANDDAVAVFSRNAATGQLTFVEQKRDGVGGVNGLAFANSVTPSPDGRHVYATGVLSVAVFGRNVSTGALTFVESLRDDSVGGTVELLRGAAALAADPSGLHIYVAAGLDGAVLVFLRNVQTGALTFVEAQQDGVGGVDGLADVRAVTVSGNGRAVYAGSLTDNAVVLFETSIPPVPMPLVLR